MKIMKKAVSLASVLGLMALASACGGSSDNTCTAASATATNSVVASDYAFSPSCIMVAVGSTVTWTNSSQTAHTVTRTSSPESFDLPLPAGGTVTHTFATAGTYPYFCTPHESLGMTGTVIVGSASMSAPSGY
jgi:plastocyanin